MDKALFVSRLKEAKEKKGITIKELADQCGVSTSAINRYLAETSMPTLDVAINMSKALNVSLDWLCGLKSEVNTQYTTGLVLRMLSMMLTMPSMEYDTTGVKEYAAEFGIENGKVTFISVDQDKIPDVVDFETWSKLLDLCRNQTLNREVYDAWLEKKAAELDQITLPVSAPCPDWPF